jgi:hypothetical protein
MLRLWPERRGAKNVMAKLTPWIAVGAALAPVLAGSALGGVLNPITDVWAPLDGRTFNLGVRVEL